MNRCAWLGRIFPKKTFCRLSLETPAPWTVRAPKPRLIKKQLEARETVEGGHHPGVPALECVWFGSLIAVASRLAATVGATMGRMVWNIMCSTPRRRLLPRPGRGRLKGALFILPRRGANSFWVPLCFIATFLAPANFYDYRKRPRSTDESQGYGANGTLVPAKERESATDGL